MPRMQPPPGWIRGSEATARLRISDSLLSRYVLDGKIRRYVPHGRKYGFYNEDDVKILEDVSAAFLVSNISNIDRSSQSRDDQISRPLPK